MGEAALDETTAAELRRELEATRAELGEVKALLRQLISKRKPRKPEAPAVKATPELRQSIRDRLSKTNERRKRKGSR